MNILYLSSCKENGGLNFLKNEVISVIAILLGFITLMFPILGIISAGDILGLSVLLLSIFLLVYGSANMEYEKLKSVCYIILGIIMLFLAISMIFNPLLISFLIAISVYLSGLLLILIGIIVIITARDNHYNFWTGIIGVLMGALYIVLATYIENPIILGSLIGIWLIIAGVFNLLN